MVFIYEHFFSLLLAALTILFAYLWFKARDGRAVSKPDFALRAIAACISCLTVTISAISGGLISSVAGAILALLGIKTSDNYTLIHFAGNLIFVLAMGYTTYAIYRISTETIKYWDGPQTVIANNLARIGYHNNIFRLAAAELQRYTEGLTYPIVASAVINWVHTQRDPPSSPKWENFARELFLAAFH